MLWAVEGGAHPVEVKRGSYDAMHRLFATRPLIEFFNQAPTVFDRTDLDLPTAAYHEAGHVLMAHLLGGNVVSVTLESEDDAMGGVTTVRWSSDNHSDRQRCSALVALAGPLAEARWRGEAIALDAFTAWRGDWQEVEQALVAQAQGSDPIKLLHQWLGKVRQQFDDPLIWEVLCRVADALEAHGTLDEDLLDDVLARV